MYTIKHSLAFQPLDTVSGLLDESAAQAQSAAADAQHTAPAAKAVSLGANKLAVIPGGHGVTITCSEGALWVTEDWSPTDVELRSNERFKSTNAGRIIIQAFERSSYRVSVEQMPWWSRVVRAVAKRTALAMRVARPHLSASQSDQPDAVRRAPLPYC